MKKKLKRRLIFFSLNSNRNSKAPIPKRIPQRKDFDPNDPFDLGSFEAVTGEEGFGDEEGEEGNEYPPIIEYVYDGLGTMIAYVEEEVPLIQGLQEKLYTNEEWEHAFKETLLESMGDLVDKVTAPHMLLLSTVVITGGVVFKNYQALRAEGQDPFSFVKSKSTIYSTSEERPQTQREEQSRIQIDELYGNSQNKKRKQ